MLHPQIDYYFPFITFFYGALILFVLTHPKLVEVGKNKMPEAYKQLQAHQGLAWLCFVVGGLWSIQNIWLA